MRYLLMLWLISAGAGISYSVISERKEQITLLKSMEYTIKQLAYYMYQWRMPVEETVHKLIEENTQPALLLNMIYEQLGNKESAALGEVWKKNSDEWFRYKKLPDNIKTIWADLFLYMPIEPEGLYHKLLLKKEELTAKREELEQKYKGEQRLVMSMGICIGLFFCLIL